MLHVFSLLFYRLLGEAFPTLWIKMPEKCFECNRGGENNVALFKFPSDLEKAANWLRILGKDEELFLPRISRLRICADHFSSNMYSTGKIVSSIPKLYQLCTIGPNQPRIQKLTSLHNVTLLAL